MHHVHILDPQLSGQGGHYLSHDGQLLAELQRRNIPVTLYGRRELKVTHCIGAEIVPAFSHDIFREVATDALVWPMENFARNNEDFLADLLALDPARFSADDLVYFPNILQNQVHGIAQWLAQLPAARRPAVALMFRYLNHAMDYVQKRQNKDMVALYYRFAVRHLVATHPRTLICADTTELAKAYQQITTVPVLELPNPMDVSALLAAQGDTRPATGGILPTIVYQGHTSPLRGFHFLPEIIERCAKLTPRPRFLVQVQNREAAAGMGLGPALAALDKMKGEHLRLLEGPLNQTDYLTLLSSADIVLLPYTPTFYGVGSSGVFTEAASVGKITIACAGTVPARQAREYDLGHTTAVHWTPEAFANAIASALQTFPELRQKSEANALRFRAENCAQAFWEKLLASARALPAPAVASAA